MRLVQLLLVIALGSILSACASQDLQVEPISMTKVPAKEISRLEKAIEKAESEEVDQLSPNWFERSQKSLDKSKSIQAKGGNIRDIFSSLEYGHAELKKAKEYSKVTSSTLEEVLKKKKDALEAGASSNSKEFVKADKKLKELTDAIEKEDIEKAKENRQNVYLLFSDIEVNAIRDRHLDPVRREFRAAKKMGAKKYAPSALEMAEKSIMSADQFIEANRYDEQAIKLVTKKAMFYSKRAQSLAENSRFIRDSDSEDVALWLEKNMQGLANSLGRDYRNYPVTEQFQKVVKNISQLKGTRESLIGQGRQLKSELSNLKKEKEKEKERVARLIREKEFESRYNKIQRSFNSSEAEVYKDGRKLVIRLKGVEFPSGKSILLSKNYSLLKKVRAAIGEFTNSQVKIEGHTDSVGSVKVNQWLSQERAKSVRDYLVAHDTLSQGRVEAVGLGFSKPIASNKTKAGRAANRRIDVVIDPSLLEDSVVE